MSFQTDFADDPDFGESVIMQQPGDSPVTVNAVVYRHEGDTMSQNRLPGGSITGHTYSVELCIGRTVCPSVLVNGTIFTLPKRMGEEPKAMKVGAVLYNDSESFKLGLIG